MAAQRTLTVKVKTVLEGLGKVQKGLAGLKKDLGNIAGKGNAVTSSLRNMIGAFLGLQAATKGGKFIAKTVADFETLQTQLVTVHQGMEDVAAQKFDELKEFSRKTPFLLRDVTDSFIQLKARGIDVTQKDLENIGNVSAAFGRDITSFSNAVGQAVAGEAEPLKRFGIGLSFQGKKAVLTVDGVKKTIKRDGKVIARELIALGSTKFEGGIRRQAKTLSGMFSTLKDNIDIFVFEMGKAGLTDALKEVVAVLKAWFAGNKKLAASLGRQAGKAVLQFLRLVLKLADRMQKLRDWFKKVSDGAGGFKKAIQALIAGAATAAIVKGFMMLWGVIQAVGAAMTTMFGGVTLVAGAKLLALITAIVAAIVLLFLAVDEVVTFFRGGDTLIGRFLKNIEGETEGTVGRINNLVKTAVETWKAFKPTFEAIVLFLETILPDALSVLSVWFKVPFMILENAVLFGILLLTNIMITVQALIALLQGDGTTAMEKFKEFGVNIFETLEAMANNVFGVFADWLKSVAGLVGSVFEGSKDFIAQVKGPDPGSGFDFKPPPPTDGLAGAPAPGRAAAGATAGPTTINVNAPVNASGVTDPEKVADMAGKKIGAETARAAKQAAAQTARGER